MKPYFYLIFLLSLSLAGQTKDAQKRLYYNIMDNGKQLYIMGKYQLELIPYDEAFDSLVVKRNLVDFAKKNHFTDTIVKKIRSCPILIIIFLIIRKIRRITGRIQWYIT